MSKAIKKYISIIIATMLMFSLAACGEKEDKEEDKTTKASESTQIVYGEEYIKNHAPKEYKLSYKISVTEEGSKTTEAPYTITIAKNSEGVYLKMADMEQVFLKRDNGYEQFVYDSNTAEWTSLSTLGGIEADDSAYLTQEEVDDLTTSFTTYFVYYTDFKDEMKYDGKEDYLGRKCEKYKYKGGIPGYNAQYDILIDKETGICLKFSTTVKAAGDMASANFETTEFVTSGIELPKVA